MIKFNHVTVASKEVFDRYMQASDIRNCDMAFTNIFCWQEVYRSAWAEVEGFLVVRFHIDGGTKVAYMQPVGADGDDDFTRIVPLLEEDAAAAGQPLRIAGLTDRAADLLRRTFPGKFAYADNRNFADYIYDADSLRNLQGRKYQPKRNHINRFTGEYEYRYEPLAAQHKEECMTLEAEWSKSHTDNRRSITAERHAMLRGFDHFDALGLTGGAIYVGDRLAAFTYGSPINGETFDIHIEKADTSFDGIFAAINMLFARHIPERYRYINREEDMGIEGLRQSKLSYHPAMHENKTTAVVLDGDKRSIKRLWQEVFGDDEAFIDKFLINYHTHANTFTIKDGERTVSMLHVVHFRSETGLRIAYIYAVATAAEYRHRGYASKLLEEALEKARHTSDAAILIPGDEAAERLYSRFGFEKSGHRAVFGTDFDFGTGDAERDLFMALEFRHTALRDENPLMLHKAEFTAIPQDNKQQ